MNQEERDNEQLGIILKYLDRLDHTVNRFDHSYEFFQNDISFQDSCSLCFIQIGEASNRLSSEYKDEHADIPWKRIYGLRCHLVHGYESFDTEIVWDAIENYAPVLRNFCETHYRQ